MKESDELKLTVGIGASAGGLAILKKLVNTFQKDRNIAYIIVQHLDPTHDSMLTELLRKETKLNIQVAENKMLIESDNIYVIPPNTFLEIKKGKIKLTTPQQVRGTRKAIDHLFRSMSRECKHKCVGIVLTGAGNDGTAGLRVLKASGGFTIAQDPKSAEHPSMPESAINSGVIDKVLPVAEIFATLEEYLNHPYLALANDNKGEDFEIENSLQEMGSILESREDFDLNQYKPGTIQRRISRRMGLAGMKDIREYLEKTRSDDEERKLLIKDLLINVTDFFRDPDAFKELEDKIVPSILKTLSNDEDLRVWVAGCATGEEVYSITILLLEALSEYNVKSNIRVFATDVDEEAIAIARKGIYPASVISEVPDNYLKHYFRKIKDDYYEIKQQVRDHISFAHQNVVTDPPFSKMHLISCRNLLIYLKKEVQQDVLNAFHFALKPSGYLFLGSAESLGPNSTNFNVVSKKWRLYKREEASAVRLEFQKRYRVRGSSKESDKKVESRDKGTSRSEQLRSDLLRTALPPSMIIGSKGEILYNHGNLSPYLTVPEGEPHSDLFRTLIPALSSRIRSAVYKTKKSKDIVKFTYLPQSGSEKNQIVEVIVQPFMRLYSSINEGVCISFVEQTDFETGIDISQNLDQDKAVQQIEQELIETKEELQNTIEELETSTEELKASHEEALSTNEELQSANEELEASTEELRSLNEELRTVNDQLKEKIEELQSINNDIENFFSSTNIPTLFLDVSLRIQRYTPAIELLLGIGEMDIGRSVHSIGSNLLNDNFIHQAKKVLLTFESVTTEIETDNKNWYTRVTSPYTTEDRRIEGVVVTFQNISVIKKLSEAADRRERQQAAVAQLGMLALTEISIEDFMDNLVRKVAHTLDVEYCKILKFRPKKNDLLLVSGTGWRQGIVGHASVPDNQDSQAGYTLIQNEPVIVNSMKAEKRFKGPDLLLDHDVVCGITVTINHTNPPYGVLGVHSKTYQDFDGDDANFIQSIANLLSIAIKNNLVNDALRESENRLRIAKDSAEIGAFEFSMEKEDTKWDPLIKKLLGYPKSKKPTQEIFWKSVHQDDVLSIKKAIEKSSDPDGDGHFSSRYRLINSQDSTESWVQGSGRIFFKDGKPVKMIGMIQNITDFKKLEISLQKAVDELNEVNRRKNEFLATLGHELRNPLAAIAGGIELLKMNNEGGEKLTSILSRNVKMISEMLDDLLDLARIDNGTVRLNMQEIDLNELIKRTASECMPLFIAKNQEVKFKTSQDEPIYILGDATRLEQIFLNLFNNAQKFTHKNGLIEVNIEKQNDYVKVFLKDNGIGLEGDSNSIFKPFMQINPSKGNKGLGLGLALVQRFTKMHNGDISVSSDGKGKGCEFTLSFPLLKISNIQKANLSNNSNGSIIKQGLRVLIVDDNEDMNSLLELKLKKFNCKVSVANNGSIALKLVNEVKPEVLLLDIGLPDMDGHQLLKEIKKIYPDPAVYIAHTGYGHEEARESTKRSGFNFHLTKPLELKKFIELLAQL